MNKNTLYAVLWAVITLTSAPAIAMDIQSSAAPMNVDTTVNKVTGKRKADQMVSTSSDSKEEKSPVQNGFKCTESGCTKSFSDKSNLRRHMKTHTGERPFKCEKKGCGETFARKETLTRHTRTHTGERPYACLTCGKTFTQDKSLVVHAKTHTKNKKSFKCEKCGETFAQKETLRRHTRTHTGERPYACKECDKTFAQQVALTNHTKRHTGEKPYACTTCNMKFARKSVLNRHFENKSHIAAMAKKNSNTLIQPAVESVPAIVAQQIIQHMHSASEEPLHTQAPQNVASPLSSSSADFNELTLSMPEIDDDPEAQKFIDSVLN